MSPCMDPRDDLARTALGEHHRALERIVERMVADERVPDEYRAELEREKALFELDTHAISERGVRGRE